MKRNELVQIEEQKIRDAIHAKELYGTLPVNSFLTIEYTLSQNILSYASSIASGGKILAKIRIMRNFPSGSGHIVLNILAANTNTRIFEIGSGPDFYKMTPDKIRHWERVSKKDLPLFLGWPKLFPAFAKFLKK